MKPLDSFTNIILEILNQTERMVVQDPQFTTVYSGLYLSDLQYVIDMLGLYI